MTYSLSILHFWHIFGVGHFPYATIAAFNVGVKTVVFPYFGQNSDGATSGSVPLSIESALPGYIHCSTSSIFAYSLQIENVRFAGVNFQFQPCFLLEKQRRENIIA